MGALLLAVAKYIYYVLLAEYIKSRLNLTCPPAINTPD